MLNRSNRNISSRSTSVVAIVACVIGSISILSEQNYLDKEPILSNNNKLKIGLEVICNEAAGFCELKKNVSEQSNEPSFTVTPLSVVPRDFHCPAFVKLYYFQKDEQTKIQSHIKIADSPPPIFG